MNIYKRILHIGIAVGLIAVAMILATVEEEGPSVIALILGIIKANLGNYAEIIAVVIRILALLLVLFIYSQNKTGSIKIPWIILILLFPPVGVSLYFLIGLSGSTRKMRKRYAEMDAKLMPNLVQDDEILSALAASERVFQLLDAPEEAAQQY